MGSNTSCSNVIVAIVNEDGTVAVLIIAIVVVAIETVVVAAVFVIYATTFVSAIVFDVTKLFVQLL